MGAEKALKEREEVPFYTVLAHFKIGECMTVLFVMFVEESLEAHSLVGKRFLAFQNFDNSVWSLLVALLIDGWTTALLVKHLSNVSKGVAKCASLVVLYVISVFVPGTAAPVLGKMFLALLIVHGSGSFSYASATLPEDKTGKKTGKEQQDVSPEEPTRVVTAPRL